MVHEYIEHHPNIGKTIVCTEAYLQQRYALTKQIAAIESTIQGTMLHNEWDITRRLLPSLKRQLNGLQGRFEKMRCSVDVVMCAQCILNGETEMIKEPLQCCRYYDGKAIESGMKNALLAEYEMLWIEWRSAALDSGNYRLIFDMVTEYMNYGLMMFADNDKAPLSLKALLFNRYCHWNYAGAEEFKYWYNNTYSKEALR